MHVFAESANRFRFFRAIAKTADGFFWPIYLWHTIAVSACTLAMRRAEAGERRGPAHLKLEFIHAIERFTFAYLFHQIALTHDALRANRDLS